MLEVRDEQGRVIVSPERRMSRLVGENSVTTTANVAGSLTVPVSGTPFLFLVGATGVGQGRPIFTVNGSTISWNAAPIAVSFIYGVF